MTHVEGIIFKRSRNCNGIFGIPVNQMQPALLIDVLAIICIVHAAVQPLNYINFDETLKSNKFVLVSFIPVRCVDCESAVPVFNKLSEKYDNSTLIFGRVECSSNDDSYLCSKYKVNPTYPMVIKLFDSKHYTPLDYLETVNVTGIDKWLKKKMEENPIIVHSLAEIEKLHEKCKATNTSLVVAFFESRRSKTYRQFIESTIRIDLDYFVFAECIGCDEQALEEYEVEDDQIVVLRYDDEIARTEEFEKLPSFLSTSGCPPIDQLNERSIRRMQTTPMLTCVLYIDKIDFWSVPEMLTIYEAIKEVAKFFVGQVVFFYADYRDYADHFSRVNMSVIPLPKLIAFSEAGSFAYPFNSTGTDPLGVWLKKILNRQIEPYLRSETPPANNDKPVKVLVANELNDKLTNNTKDVVVLFYAEENIDCQAFLPVYAELAESLSHVEPMVFYKIEVTKNDIPKMKMNPYPSIYVFPGHAKQSPTLYNGNKSIQDLKKFLNTHCKTSRAFITKHKQKKSDEL